MFWVDLARASRVAAVPALWALGALGALALALPLLTAMAFAHGTLSVLDCVSTGTLFVARVPRERYVEANALLAKGWAGAFGLGPAVAGFLVQTRSAPVSLIADAVSLLPSPSRSGASGRWSRPRAEPRPGDLPEGIWGV